MIDKIKNKKTLIIVSSVIIVVVLVISLWWYPAVKKINEAYPDYTVNEIAENKTASIGDILIGTEGLKFYTVDEFCSFFMSGEYEDSDTAEMLRECYNPDETRIGLVNFNITYNGEGEITAGEIIDKYMIYLQSGFISVPYEMPYIPCVNSNREIPKTILTGDSFTVTLPFFVTKAFYENIDFDKLKKERFCAVINFYPQRYIFKLCGDDAI